MLTIGERAAPSTPASGYVSLYAKSDGILYAKDDAGVEYPVSSESLIGTLTATTSGTSRDDFAAFPAGTKRIVISFNGVSSNGTDPFILQLGDAGDIEATGYNNVYTTFSTSAAVSVAASTAGFQLNNPGNATSTFFGQAVLVLMDAATNLWSFSCQLADVNQTRYHHCAGTKALSATLTRIRLTTTGGSNTFDAGSWNVAYAP